MYCILDNQVQAYTTATYLSFAINGSTVGTYQHTPTGDGVGGFLYNVAVYSKKSLPNGNHTISIATVADNRSSLFLFDYIVYTYANPLFALFTPVA